MREVVVGFVADAVVSYIAYWRLGIEVKVEHGDWKSETGSTMGIVVLTGPEQLKKVLAQVYAELDCFD